MPLFAVLIPSATHPCFSSPLRWAGPWHLIVLSRPNTNKWQPSFATARCSDTHTCISIAGRGPITQPWASRGTYKTSDAVCLHICSSMDESSHEQSSMHVYCRFMDTRGETEISMDTQTRSPLSNPVCVFSHNPRFYMNLDLFSQMRCSSLI